MNNKQRDQELIILLASTLGLKYRHHLSDKAYFNLLLKAMRDSYKLGSMIYGTKIPK